MSSGIGGKYIIVIDSFDVRWVKTNPCFNYQRDRNRNSFSLDVKKTKS